MRSEKLSSRRYNEEIRRSIDRALSTKKVMHKNELRWQFRTDKLCRLKSFPKVQRRNTRKYCQDLVRRSVMHTNDFTKQEGKRKVAQSGTEDIEELRGAATR